MTFVGQAVSHAMQSMQSDSRIMSDLSHRYLSHSSPPFSMILSFPVPFLPGARSHSKTSTGQTSMQTPSATQPSKSTATWRPWIPSFVGYGVPLASGRAMPSAKTLWSKWVPVSGYSSGLFMKSGSIGFAAKSTSRDILSAPKGWARPFSGPGNGLYTPPLFDLSGFVSRAVWGTRHFCRFMIPRTRNLFRWKLQSPAGEQASGHADTRRPRSASEAARPDRHPDLRELHLGSCFCPPGRGLRRRDGAARILHPMGQSD